MTTILADFHKRIMVADSAISDGDRMWSGRKVWRIGKSIIGFAGDVSEAHAMIAWLKTGAQGNPPPFKNSHALLMNSEGLFYYAASKYGIAVESGIDSIGTGAKAVMCTYEALEFENPQKALKIVCKHDAGSRPPIKTYKL